MKTFTTICVCCGQNPVSKDYVIAMIRRGLLGGVVCDMNNEATLLSDGNKMPINWLMLSADASGLHIYNKFTNERYYE